MMKLCGESTEMFEEAIDHSRWKTVMLNTIETRIEYRNYKNRTFESILTDVSSICESIKGIGPLGKYDITAGICRKYNINIERVYIIGGGPIRAIKLLKLTTKSHRINDKVKLQYVSIGDIVNAFDRCGFYLDETIKTTTDGDKVESFICNWQKNIK